MNSLIGVKGMFKACLKKANGQVLMVTKTNMILDTGYKLISDRLIGVVDAKHISHIAVGIDSTATSSSQTGLLDELAVREANITYDPANKSITIAAYFGNDVIGAITEAGICTSDKVFLDRSTFDVLNKGSDDELTIRFIISFSEI